MGDWGGAPPDWIPPEERAEQAAAAEAAAAMEARRAQADERSSALATAIRDGFAMLAAAVMAARPGVEPSLALERFEDIWSGLADPDGSNMAPPQDVPEHGAVLGHIVAEAADVVDAEVVDDPDIDDLIEDGD